MSRELAAQNKPLHKTFTFWIAILVPLISGTWLANKIYLASTLDYSYDPSILDKLLIAYKLPIGVAGLAIPFVAVVAAIHRSQQTAEQIAAQTEQNNFANHFKHLEEFKKTFDSKTPPYPWSSTEELHQVVYPNSKNGDLKPSQQFYDFHGKFYRFIVDFKLSKLDCFTDVNTLLDESNKVLFASRKIKNFGSIKAALYNVQKALNFSSMHQPLTPPFEEFEDRFGSINTFYGLVEKAIKDPDHFLSRIMENGLYSSFNTNEHFKFDDDEFEVSVILNSLSYLDSQESSDFDVRLFFDSLSPHGLQNLRNFIDLYEKKYEHSRHRIVTTLDNLLKDIGV